MDFENFSKETARQINQEVKKLLVEWRSEVGKESKVLLPLVDQFIESCKGGKSLRGNLVVLGYEITSSKFKIQNSKLRQEIIKIAAAYEIFHSAILAHDDVIDQSLLRRGKPSLYQALGGNHYGVSQAVCLGDCGFFLSAKVISETDFPEKIKIEALKFFFQTMLYTGVGEMLDVRQGSVETIMLLKTARYSIAGPLILGAILAGIGENLIRVFREFGENLGIAYQIQDDILGIFGSEEILGKSITSDIEEGKNTLLFAYALKNANPKQKQSLKKLYGRGRIDGQRAKTVREIFDTTGAVIFAKKEAEKYQKAALKVLPQITKDSKMSKILQQLIEYLINRNK